MPNLLIKHKIWTGFSFLLILLLINAGISSYNLSSTKTTVGSLIEKSQPLVLAAHQFNGFLAQTSGALGNYLLIQGYEKQMLLYAKNSLENETALSYASQSINPLSNSILNALGICRAGTGCRQGFYRSSSFSLRFNRVISFVC